MLVEGIALRVRTTSAVAWFAKRMKHGRIREDFVLIIRRERIQL